MQYRGALFDFNGTLLWDTSYHNRAHDIFLEKHHIYLTDEEKSFKIHGKPNPEVFDALFERPLSPEEIRGMILEKELIYQQLIVQDLRFAPGAEELLCWLKDERIPFAIATSAGIENVDFYFQHLNLERWFDRSLVIYDDGSFMGKPEPDIFVKTAERIKLPPSEIVIFEDSKAGIIAAERAGAGKIYIVDSNHDNYSPFTHTIITHFDQVDRGIFARPGSCRGKMGTDSILRHSLDMSSRATSS
jgi:beta-phosphoglucomutase